MLWFIVSVGSAMKKMEQAREQPNQKSEKSKTGRINA